MLHILHSSYSSCKFWSIYSSTADAGAYAEMVPGRYLAPSEQTVFKSVQYFVHIFRVVHWSALAVIGTSYPLARNTQSHGFSTWF